MKKVRANASWNKLTVNQQETLDKWLFEEKHSYAEILTRAKNELGFKGSKTSLHRYCYVRRDSERILTKFCDAREQVAAVSGAPASEKELRVASMKLLSEFLFQQIRQSPDKVKEWGAIASLIVDNDRNELVREIKGEELKMRQQAMAFAREKFQFDMVKRALKALPEIRQLAEAKKDPALTEYEENIRLNRMIRAMFGSSSEVHPESPQEAREMLAAKREREARQKAEQEAVAERRRIRDELGGAQPPTPSSQYYEEYMEDKDEDEAEARERGEAYLKSQVETSETEQTERNKSQEQRAAQAAEAEQARREKLRKQQEDQARIEELRELCGWQEVERPPGWDDRK